MGKLLDLVYELLTRFLVGCLIFSLFMIVLAFMVQAIKLFWTFITVLFL